MKKEEGFLQLAEKRQSVRRYKPDEVEKEKLNRCLEAIRIAPSASNSQPWHCIIVDEPDLKNKVASCTYDNLLTFNKFTKQAPVIIVMVIEKPKLITQIGGTVKKKEFPLIDIGIAAEHFCLQAAEEGLGTCMIGWFNQKKIRTLLRIPSSKTIGLLITVGYAADNYQLREKIRKGANEIFSYNKY